MKNFRRVQIVFLLLAAALPCMKAFCGVSYRRASCRLFQQLPLGEDGYFDDDDDDDDDVPEIDTSKFQPPQFLAFGLSGRSSPSHRKAIGTSRSSNATIYFCTKCGTEYVRWVGQCGTCESWNTIQARTVPRLSEEEIQAIKVTEEMRVEDNGDIEIDSPPEAPVEEFGPTFFEEVETKIITPIIPLIGSTLTTTGSEPKESFISEEGQARTLRGNEVAFVQALVAEGDGKRSTSGLEPERLRRILSILQKKCGINLRNFDVYVDTTPDIDHTSDLAVALAVLSSRFSIALPQDTLYVGTIDLVGYLKGIDISADNIAEVSGNRLVGAASENCPVEISLTRCLSLMQAVDLVLGNIDDSVGNATV